LLIAYYFSTTSASPAGPHAACLGRTENALTVI
jgi:hypothetical protein